VEGAAAWALSALSTEITLERGRVVQGTYRDFPILRFRDMPRVETAIVDSDAPPTGMGEPPVPIVVAAAGERDLRRVREAHPPAARARGGRERFRRRRKGVVTWRRSPSS
jgi:hypothetical protein